MCKESEALKRIEATLEIGLKDKVYVKELGVTANIDKEGLLNSVRVIREALERNESMKPQTKTYTNGFFMKRTCSVCDTTIQKEFAYCPYCGQKLDWSDES